MYQIGTTSVLPSFLMVPSFLVNVPFIRNSLISLLDISAITQVYFSIGIYKFKNNQISEQGRQPDPVIVFHSILLQQNIEHTNNNLTVLDETILVIASRMYLYLIVSIR
jgi:hypothetical protein